MTKMVSNLLSFGFVFSISIAITWFWGSLYQIKNFGLCTCLIEFLLSILFYPYLTSSESLSYVNLGIYYDLNFFFFISFIFDQLSSIFLMVLSLALSVCFAFLTEYFEYDLNGSQIVFFSLLFSQLAFLFFITADLLLLIFFWEWISIVSFWLVRYWSFRVTTLKAGIKVFSISQFGDFFFLLGSISILSTIGCSDFLVIQENCYFFSWVFLNIFFIQVPVTLFWSFSFIFALLLKSAQIIFFPWLLDAMEAPVPISAQLHSSTLVIIGFYVIFRFWQIVSMNKFSLYFLGFSGLLTSIGASVTGFFQEDGKRLLACSTAGQLGYVLVGLSLDLYFESLFLLFFCCVNKAYTFIWLGSLMDRQNGLSDFRKLGSLNFLFIERCGLISAIANSTFFPGLFVFHIKSLFSRGLLESDNFILSFFLDFTFLTWVLTSIYLFRFFLVIFFSTSHQKKIDLLTVFSFCNLRKLLTLFLQYFIFLILVGFSFFSIILICYIRELADDFFNF